MPSAPHVVERTPHKSDLSEERATSVCFEQVYVHCAILIQILYIGVVCRIIHENGYSREERLHYRPVVFSNTVQSIHAVVRAMFALRIPFASQQAIVCTQVKYYV